MDDDPRVRAVWGRIEPVWLQNEGVTVEFIEKYDYRQLVDPTYEHMSFFQVRENNTLTERIEKNKVRFFGKSPEELKKSPIIFKFVDDSEEVVQAAVMGNGRGYCFKEENSENSFQPAIVVTFPPGTPTANIFNYAFEAASESNTTRSEDVEPEGQRDIIQQLRTKYLGLQLLGEVTTKQEAIPILLQWMSKKPDYCKPEQASVRTSMVNVALQHGRSDATPKSADLEIERQWRKAFGVPFNLKNTDKVVKLRNNGYSADIKRTLLNDWESYPATTRKSAWLVLRVGKDGGHAITSIKSINEKRIVLLKTLKEMNTNSNRVSANMQIVTRVMFEKQLTDPNNKWTAHEWCPDSEEFIKKSC
tara:strand:- start:2099 stop:3181 length:1083 start_codon:yes stop_codon:yes gene_type:complete